MSSLKNQDKNSKGTYWRSFDQLESNQEFNKFAKAEFADSFTEKNDPISRRTFVSIMGASLAMAGLAGCRRPVEKIVPFVDQPENLVLGEPEHYATVMPFGTSAYGLLVTCNEGRPTKIEGNELHPSTLGKSNSFLQASILNLYDPDRSKNPVKNGKKESWLSFADFWNTNREDFENSNGEGLVILSDESPSLSLYRLHKEFLKKFPKAKWVVYNSISDETIYGGIKLATGKDLRPVYAYDKAKVILSLDADILMLEQESITASNGFALGRNPEESHGDMNRLYAVEPGYSITGAMADHRLKLHARDILPFTVALGHELEREGVRIALLNEYKEVDVSGIDQKWIHAIAVDLIKNQGKSVVVGGRRQSEALHALILSINDSLGNTGKTLNLYPIKDTLVSSSHSLMGLREDIDNDKVNTLIVLGNDVIHNIPSDLKLSEKFEKIQHTIHFGYQNNETAKLCDWHINSSHFLESWGDARSSDGSLSVIQPVIEPLYYGKSDLEFVDFLMTGEIRRSHEIVRQTWAKYLRSNAFDIEWRRVLHNGLLENSIGQAVRPVLSNRKLKTFLKKHPLQSKTDGIELLFTVDYSMYDGRYTNNGWMHELPDPITKLIWDNAGLVSKKTAEKYDLDSGDIVKVTSSGKSIEIPIWILPGHVDDAITLPLGYGYKSVGRVGDGVGFDVTPLQTTEGMNFVSGASLENTGKKHRLASTQNHGSMEGRPLIREATLDEYHEDPKFAQHAVHVPDLQSLWKEHKYDKGYQWGMSIDLNSCLGCGACSIACQSENNIPIVGKNNGDYGREMHWIRVDRYFNGDDDNPEIGFQPVSCQHCEMAPCEQVCPVAATTHDVEGLNVMTYNRCIGTRYCSNNCPYKARRFNFFNYTNSLPELIQMAQNPDVTVRSRGVMEKCTYCTQRINRSKRVAKLEDRTLRDGEMRTACQQACPTNAISFGNILDTESEIVKAKSSDRTYEILAEFNLRPRTSYMARLRNPNPKLHNS